MKKINITLLLVTLATGLLLMHQSCDKIEEPFVELTSSDTISSGDDTTSADVRKILLEDITGHKCPNCPEAAFEAQNLKSKYGEQLVIMTVHAGFYSSPSASGEFTYDFRTAVGAEIHDFYGFIFYPAGLVSRTTPEGAPSPVLGKGDWEGAISDLVNLPQQASISIENYYDPGSGKLSTTLEVEFLESLDGVYNVVAYLIENGIVKPQESEAGVIEDYEHEHVLRASLNGAWGDPVGGDGNAVSGKTSTHELSLVMDPEWVPANCAVIAVVHRFDSPTRYIIQAEELKITN